MKVGAFLKAFLPSRKKSSKYKVKQLINMASWIGLTLCNHSQCHIVSEKRKSIRKSTVYGRISWFYEMFLFVFSNWNITARHYVVFLKFIQYLIFANVWCYSSTVMLFYLNWNTLVSLCSTQETPNSCTNGFGKNRLNVICQKRRKRIEYTMQKYIICGLNFSNIKTLR